MRFRYRYVGYGTRFSPEKGPRPEGESDPSKLYENELAVDIGGVCWGVDGVEQPVLDHHFYREAGQYPSAAAAVLHNAFRVKRLGALDGDIWLVAHRDPDFDAFCAMFLARCILEKVIPSEGWDALGLRTDGWYQGEEEINWFNPDVEHCPDERRWPVLLASYAACVDNCRRLECRKERALHSVLYAAIRNGRDYRSETSGALEFFQEVADRLKAGGVNPLADSVLESSSRFSPELKSLDREVEVYKNDIRRARRATVILLEATVPFKEWFPFVLNAPLLKKDGSINTIHLQPPHCQRRSPADGIYIRDPRCLLFKEWARSDTDNSPLGEGFLFTAIAYSKGRSDSPLNQTDYYFSLDPERAGSRNLYNVWARLQAEEVLSEVISLNSSPQEGEPRRGFAARAEGHEGYFVDPWFDGSNYACTLVATPNRGTRIEKAGQAPDLNDDSIAKIVREELETPIIDVTVLDLTASIEPPEGMPQTTQDPLPYSLVDALQKNSSPLERCYRYCWVTLANSVDTLRDKTAQPIGYQLWTLLEGKNGPGVPPEFDNRHLVVDAAGVGVWSRHGIVVALKKSDSATKRFKVIQDDFRELTAIARDTEELLNRPAIDRADQEWAKRNEERVDQGERLMRRIVKLRFGLVLPERRVLQQFFEAIQLDEVVEMLRDVNSVDVERAQTARMGENTEKIQEHIEAVAEVQSAFHWIEIFLISVYAVELFNILGENFEFKKIFIGCSLVLAGVGAAMFMLFGMPRGKEGIPGYMKVFFAGMAMLLVLFLAVGMVYYRHEGQTGQLQLVPGFPNLQIRQGYQLSLLTNRLNFPTAITFGPRGEIWVSESGTGGTTPSIIQINQDGTFFRVLSSDQLLKGTLNGPINDVTYHDGWLWIAHSQTAIKGDNVNANGWNVGAISKFRPGDSFGTFSTVIPNLPPAGDHATDEIVFDRRGMAYQIVFDRRGMAYFSQGTATNSGVVGTDDSLSERSSNFHDFAPVRIVLSGSSYPIPSPSQPTSPYMPFGVSAPAGTVVPAATPTTPQQGIIAGNGTVYSFNPNAPDPVSTLRLLGWGLRNPYGIGFNPSKPNELFVTNSGADSRGSRPLINEYDDLFAIDLFAINARRGQPDFFGWPDFFDDPQTGRRLPALPALPVTNPLFSASGTTVQPVFASSFSKSLNVKPAVTELGNHTAVGKFDISTDPQFGLVGDLFVARTGSLPPGTGATSLVGYDVVSVNPQTGKVSEFLTHNGNSPDVIFNPSSLDKPIDVRFHNNQMFIVDFGVFNTSQPGGIEPYTGKVWKVTRSE